jgi:hypothetical protein
LGQAKVDSVVQLCFSLFFAHVKNLSKFFRPVKPPLLLGFYLICLHW